MKRSIHLRLAGPEDAQRLSEIAVESKAYWGYSTQFMSSCQTELTVSADDMAREDFRYVLAERNNSILGFYSLQVLSKGELELDAMFVHPTHIGTGIGRILVEHALLLARELDAESILVQSDPNAEAFYRRMGGELVGSRESNSIPGRKLPLLRLRC